MFIYSQIWTVTSKKSPINDELARVWEKRSWPSRGTIPAPAMKNFRQDSRRPDAAHGHIYKLHKYRNYTTI